MRDTNAIDLTDEQCAAMTPDAVYRAFFPLPDRGPDEEDEANRRCRRLGFNGSAPWHYACVEQIWDRGRGGDRRSDLFVEDLGRTGGLEGAGRSARIGTIYYRNTGFLKGHYEWRNRKFNHWGGPTGVFILAAAVGMAELYEYQSRRRRARSGTPGG